jgi:tRNA(fMet)-specific endonuclease VapC
VTAYLLDTNHLSPLVTIGHPLRKQVLSLLGQRDQFAIAAPILTEFLFGIQLVPRAKSNLAEWERLQGSFGYYAINCTDAIEAAALQIGLRRQGRQLATVDALLAVVALRNRLTLLTTDGDFEAVPHLRQENWLTGQQQW